jgi:hypothetical protein
MQDSIDFALVQELRVFGLDRFQFDGHLLASRHVGTQIYITEGTTANLPTEAVLLAHPKLHDDFNNVSLNGQSERRKNDQAKTPATASAAPRSSPQQGTDDFPYASTTTANLQRLDEAETDRSFWPDRSGSGAMQRYDMRRWCREWRGRSS